MKIVVDIFGGDYSPVEQVKGCVSAINTQDGFTLVLSGDKEIVEQELSNYTFDKSRIEFIDAKEIITNEESPIEAIRRKSNSGLVRAFNYLNIEPEAKAIVSCGSTGAVLTAAVLLLKRIKGIQRPALAPILPTVAEDKRVVLVDCGANVEPKATNLLQFGIMGSAYMTAVEGIKEPSVYLLSNGVEDKKGTALNKEAFALLKNSGLNFKGNMEARELLSGEAEVVVSDGFSGNIALKGCEGTALSLFSLIKKGIMNGGLRAKLGYLLLKPALKWVKGKMDYNESGGAVLLGLKQVVIKSHGSSKAKAVCASIIQAKNLIEKNLIEKIEQSINNESI